MYDTATTVEELLHEAVWKAVNMPVYLRPLYRKIIDSEATVKDLIDLANLKACENLMTTMMASEPPTLDFFKAIVEIPKQELRTKWGIYIHVLTRANSATITYCGSGTAYTGGVQSRLDEYRRGKMIPVGVKKALNNGYKLASTHLLLTCNIPEARNVSIIRVLFHVFEAIFSFTFWTMKETKASNNWGFDSFCPWGIGSMEWVGCCSHNPMQEEIPGNFNLSPEDVEAAAAEVKERNRLYGVEYARAQRIRSPEKVRARQRKSNHKRADVQKAQWDGVKQSGVFNCEVCDVNFRHAADQRKHNKCARHLRKVQEAAQATASVTTDYCYHCNVRMRYPTERTRHLESAGHRRKMAKVTKLEKMADKDRIMD